MKIVVFIKQVPDTTQVKINPETNTLIRSGVDSIINPFDMYAIEQALRLRDQSPDGGTVTVMTMGPPQAESALREAMAMGCDDAVLLSDRKFAGSDTWATSYTLAHGLARLGDVDIAVCGKQASDGDTAQVGPGIAQHMNLPCVSFVSKVEKCSDGKMTVHRMVEEGFEIIELPLPCLITVVKDIGDPRLPSLRGKMRAKKAEIPVWSAADIKADDSEIGLDGSPTFVVRIFTPEIRGDGQIIEGMPGEVAQKLFDNLREAKVI